MTVALILGPLAQPPVTLKIESVSSMRCGGSISAHSVMMYSVSRSPVCIISISKSLRRRPHLQQRRCHRLAVVCAHCIELATLQKVDEGEGGCGQVQPRIQVRLTFDRCPQLLQFRAYDQATGAMA